MYALASLGSPPLWRGRRGTMCTAKGSDVRPGVPWVSAAFAWQAWDNVHCQGLGCTPWRPLGLRLFGVAGVGQCALSRARMYALASLGSPPLWRGRRGTMCTAKGSDVRPGVPWVSAAFAWQAWNNVHCQGLGCTPWRPLGLRRFCVAGVGQCALSRARMYALASLGSPPLWRGRRGTMCTAKGSDVRPGVLGSPPLLRGRRGTMCTGKGSDVRPGVPWFSAAFAWQAWHNVHCQGLGCTPWRPLGLRLAGVAQCALPRARMYALASLGSPPLSPWRPLGLRRFCVAGVEQCALSRARMYALASLESPPLLRGRRGTMCTVKGSDVRPGVPWVSASLAWQAWHNVHCQGLGCTPWRPLHLRRFCVAGVGQCALSRARMYALPSLGSPPLWRGRRGTINVHCQGLGCTLWRPLGPPLLRGRRGTMCTAQGLGCTPWRPLHLRRFCVAGVAQCALPRARMYALPWRPLGLRRFCVAGVAVTHTLTDSLTHSVIHSLTHPPTHSLTHSLTHSFSHAGWMDGWTDG